MKKTDGKLTAHTNFSDDVLINTEIVKCERRTLHVDGIKINELVESIGLNYALDDAVIDRLQFSYKIITSGGNEKIVRLENENDTFEDRVINQNGEPRILNINNFNLKVNGDKVEVDCSCDSKYMLEAMNRVGEAI